MKKIFLALLVLLISTVASAQTVKISVLPTKAGTNFDSSWFPVTDSGITKKIRGYVLKQATITSTNTFLGSNAGVGNTQTSITGIGASAGSSNTGPNSTFVGVNAGSSNSGNGVIAVGTNAALSNTGGSITALGYAAGSSNTGSSCTFVGQNAGLSNTFANVTVLGANATPGAANQFVLASGARITRWDVSTLTGTRTYTLPDVDSKIAGTLSATATLDFASTSAGTSSLLTITVTGAADGDAVSIGVPNASVNANSCFTAYVSATNTVTIKFNNYSSGAVDPASGTFRATVLK